MEGQRTGRGVWSQLLIVLCTFFCPVQFSLNSPRASWRGFAQRNPQKCIKQPCCYEHTFPVGSSTSSSFYLSLWLQLLYSCVKSAFETMWRSEFAWSENSLCKVWKCPSRPPRWSCNKRWIRLQQVKRRSTFDRMRVQLRLGIDLFRYYGVSPWPPPHPQPTLFCLRYITTRLLRSLGRTTLTLIMFHYQSLTVLFTGLFLLQDGPFQQQQQSSRGASSLELDKRSKKSASINVTQFHVSAVIYSCVCKGLM